MVVTVRTKKKNRNRVYVIATRTKFCSSPKSRLQRVRVKQTPIIYFECVGRLPTNIIRIVPFGPTGTHENSGE